jgi:TRAP-type C4-dicarboxylate transport system permease large subunit
VQTFVTSRVVFLLLLNALLIVVGCLMDIYSAILVVSPLIIPIAESFGISPVHTGVIFLMNMQLGFLTPPVGMDLFIASYSFNVPVGKIMKGIIPYLIMQAMILLLVTYVPWFSTVIK